MDLGQQQTLDKICPSCPPSGWMKHPSLAISFSHHVAARSSQSCLLSFPWLPASASVAAGAERPIAGVGVGVGAPFLSRFVVSLLAQATATVVDAATQISSDVGLILRSGFRLL